MKNITFHYTNEQMVKDLLAITPISQYNTAIDAGSGKNKIWFKNLPCHIKYEYEIEDGNDFFKWDKKVDWVVGNPPYHISWKFTEKALEIADVGIAWLINNQALNSHLTPRRIQTMKEKGFYLQSIQVVADKRWFGRYYYWRLSPLHTERLIFSFSKDIVLSLKNQIGKLCRKLTLNTGQTNRLIMPSAFLLEVAL